MLNFSDISIRRGTRLLFEHATFNLYRGEKIDIAGENGSFAMPGNLAVAHVAQELRATERSIAAAETADDGHRLAELYDHFDGIGGYHARSRAATLSQGLGFTTRDERRPVREFSGGWRVRLNVAKALMRRSDLLLLDEPTNHLDLDAVPWLEQWLRDYRGNYSDFEQARAARLAQNQALYARQQRAIEHIERSSAVSGPRPARRGRPKAASRRSSACSASRRHTSTRNSPSRSGSRSSCRVRCSRSRTGPRAMARRHFWKESISRSRRARIALLGHNGAGKSTVIRLLAGELPALGGERVEARDLRIGYFAQHQLEQLKEGASPLQHLRDMAGRAAAKATEQEQRDFLGTFGFRGDRVFEAIGPFSGGEKARLVLALVTYLRPNLLRTVIDEFILVADGRAEPFDGDLVHYAEGRAGRT